MYSGPSPRNLVLSVLVHGAAIAALFNVSNPAAEPDAHVENGRATEIRISGKLYYVAQLDGSQSGSSGSPLPNRLAPQKSKSPAEGRSGGIAAPRAAAAGRSPRPARAAPPTPEPSPTPAPAKAEHAGAGGNSGGGGESSPRADSRKNPAAEAGSARFHSSRSAADAAGDADADPTFVAAEPGSSADPAAELPRVHGPEADAQDSQAVPGAGAQDSADAGASARYPDAGAGAGGAAARTGGRSAHGFVDERSSDSVQRQSSGAAGQHSAAARMNRAARRPHPAPRPGPARQAADSALGQQRARPPIPARTAADPASSASNSGSAQGGFAPGNGRAAVGNGTGVGIGGRLARRKPGSGSRRQWRESRQQRRGHGREWLGR